MRSPRETAWTEPPRPSQAAPPNPAEACSHQSSPPQPRLPSVHIRKAGFEPDSLVHAPTQFPHPERPHLRETMYPEQRTASEAKSCWENPWISPQEQTLSESPLTPGGGLPVERRKAEEGGGAGGGATPPPFSSRRPAGGVSAQRPGGQVVWWRPGVGREACGAVIQAGPGEDHGVGQEWGGGVSALSDWFSGPTQHSSSPASSLQVSSRQASGRGEQPTTLADRCPLPNDAHSLLSPLGFPGGSAVKNPPTTLETGNVGWIPESGRAPGAGNGNPLPYSCLGNPMDRGAWQAIVHKQLNHHHHHQSCAQSLDGLISLDAEIFKQIA